MIGRRALALLAIVTAGCGGSTATSPPGPTERPAPTTTRTVATTTVTSTTTAATTTTTTTSAATSTTTIPPQCAPPAERVTVDQPDDFDLHQVHVVYVLPADGVDEGFDTDGTLARSVATFQTWLAAQTGGPRLRFDTCDGDLDVTFFRSPRTGEQLLTDPDFPEDVYVRDRIEDDLELAGFDHLRKLYAVYYGGPGPAISCGGGPLPPVLPGRVAAVYLRGGPDFAPCEREVWTAPGAPPSYRDIGMLHEIVHALGLVPSCATNHFEGHTGDDPTDLMYAGDLGWNPMTLDVGRDDYHEHGIPGCPDLARSAFLDPLPANAELPPAWPPDGG